MIQGLGMVLAFGHYYNLGAQQLITPIKSTSNRQRKLRLETGGLFTLLEFRGFC